MRKSSPFKVKPLNAWNLSKIKPHKIQMGEKKETQHIFRHGFPPHQAMFYDGRRSIMAGGLVDIGDGQYYLWTLFSENIKPVHLPYIFKYLNNYLSLLKYVSVHHIIRKDFPSSRKMMKLCGFKFVRDEDGELEHWIKV